MAAIVLQVCRKACPKYNLENVLTYLRRSSDVISIISRDLSSAFASNVSFGAAEKEATVEFWIKSDIAEPEDQAHKMYFPLPYKLPPRR